MRNRDKEWEKVKLKEIIKIEKNTCLPDEISDESIYIGLEDIDKQTGVINRKRYAKECDIKSNKYGFTTEHVLYGKLRPNLNKVAIPDFNGICSTDIYPIKPQREKTSRNFIFHLLHAKSFVEYASSRTNGANLPRVNERVILDYEITLPTLQTQLQIAKTIDTVVELLMLHKKQLAELDKLIKSIFYAMFGDPVTNEKGWNVKKLDDVCIKITDGEHLNPVFINDGVKMVMANNVRDSLDFNGCKFISQDDYIKFSKKCKPEYGDILLVSRGATIGRVCINDSSERFSLMGSVILIKTRKDVVANQYMLRWLQNERIRSYIFTTSSASAQEAIYMKDLKKREIVCPPLFLQEEFTKVVTRIEEQKALVQKAIDETQHLFDSLMSEYFD